MSNSISKPNSIGSITFIAYLLAIIFGISNGLWGVEATLAAADFFGTVFIRLFKFISIPIIAVSIIATLARISQSSQSGKIFRQTLFYTIFTTVLASSLAAILYLFFSPDNITTQASQSIAKVSESSYLDYVKTIVPDNFLAPFLSANVLSVLLVSAAIGLAIAKLPRQSKEQETLLTFFEGAQQVLFVLVRWIIKVLPLGIFGFITGLVIEMKNGVAVGGLGSYFATILSANILQMFLVLPLLLLLKGLNPIKVFKGMSQALMVAFFSKSSAGTLPVTMNCAESQLGVRPSVSRFVLPICTTINMNGCAAFILVTVVFLMQNAGAEITYSTLLTWIFISTLAAIGNAGVPMGCFFLSASLLASMNIPIALMGVILPIYAVIDMVETTLNVWSDSCVCTMVNKDLYE